MATIMRCVGFAQHLLRVKHAQVLQSATSQTPNKTDSWYIHIYIYIYGLRGALTTIDMLSAPELPEKRDSNIPSAPSAMASKKTSSVTSNGRSSLKSKSHSKVSTLPKGKKASLPRYPSAITLFLVAVDKRVEIQKKTNIQLPDLSKAVEAFDAQRPNVFSISETSRNAGS